MESLLMVAALFSPSPTGRAHIMIMIDYLLRTVLLIILLIQFHNSRRDHTYLLRDALVSPHESLWSKLFQFGDNPHLARGDS